MTAATTPTRNRTLPTETVRQAARTGTPTATALIVVLLRLLIPATTRTATLHGLGGPLITQDGSTLFATMTAGASGTQTSVVRFSARTGTLQAILTQPAGAASSAQWYCGVLWADPHGRHLLTQCGTTQASIEGNRHTRIHLHRLIPASPIGYANTFAW